MIRTESKQESLDKSLLSYMGESASQNDLKEAFCRDIDAYSFEFEPRTQVVGGGGRAGPVTVGPGYRDEKPNKCDVVPQSACAVGYDSSTCSGKLLFRFVYCKNKVFIKGGWKLIIPIGELRFRWFTSYWSYR